MRKDIFDFLNSERVAVLAVEMLDGSPHAATVHFAFTESPFVFFFETNQDYRKAEPLLDKSSTRASLVIGMKEDNLKTLQLDGTVRLLEQNEKQIFQDIYLRKFIEKTEKSKSNKFIPFTFVPTWWRWTDWTKPEGKIILTSK